MLGEALDGLLNVNLARVTVRQNVIIQQVSAWAAIAAATIITGIYGMNFRHMPELDWVFGYPMAITIMIVSVIMLRRYFKHWVGSDSGRRGTCVDGDRVLQLVTRSTGLDDFEWGVTLFAVAPDDLKACVYSSTRCGTTRRRRTSPSSGPSSPAWSARSDEVLAAVGVR